MKALHLFLFLSTLTLYAFSQDTIPAYHENIEYTGRIDFTDTTAPRFAYSGISIRMNFTGTSITAILKSSNSGSYYNVIIDGVVRKNIQLKIGTHKYNLANNLEDEEHEIELFKRTELLFGKNQFLGFIIDEGAHAMPCKPRDYFIEFIGNSITCGFGNEGKPGQSFSAETENHYLTYAAITSRSFNARHMAICYSGIGMYRNYGGPAEGSPGNMPNNYDRIFFGEPVPNYNFAKQPDVICINLGTNDFSTAGGDSALYVEAYLRFIDTLQVRYENPNIVCLLGSMMGGSTLENVRSYLQFIADSANKLGKGQVTFFEMSQQGDLGVGINNHPNVPQHYKNARELTEYLRSMMGWRVHALIESARTIDSHTIELTFNTSIYDEENNYSGFQLSGPDKTYSISEITRDTEEYRILHIHIEDEIKHSDELYLHYAAGTTFSKDTLALKEFMNLAVENTIEEPVNGMSAESVSAIELFPNPVTSKVINYNFTNTNFTTMKYEIVNSSGQTSLEGNLQTPSGQVDLQKLSNGIYVIQFRHNNFSYSETIILHDN